MLRRLPTARDKLLDAFSYILRRPLLGRQALPKIFCIGRNKTGTTSLASFFKRNGYRVGNQEQAELLLEDWARRDFSRIIEYCRSAEVFQDIPFSLPDTFRALDEAYPGSKFVLTMRGSAEEWYESLVRFHSKLFSSTDGPPSADDLRNFKYRRKYKGFLLHSQELIYGYPATPLYDKQAYMAHYERHNAAVRQYFSGRPDDLLILNLADPDAFTKLCQFVGLDPTRAASLPHLNRSKR